MKKNIERTNLIEVPFYELVTNEKGKKTVLYCASVLAGNKEVICKFQYEDFVQFDKTIAPQLATEVLTMPSSVLFNKNKDPKVMEKRRQLFEIYLQTVVKYEWVWNELSNLLNADIVSYLKHEKAAQARLRKKARKHELKQQVKKEQVLVLLLVLLVLVPSGPSGSSGRSAGPPGPPGRSTGRSAGPPGPPARRVQTQSAQPVQPARRVQTQSQVQRQQAPRQTAAKVTFKPPPGPPPPQNTLPPNWTEYKDPHGRTYFYNHVTKQSSWTKPTS